MGNAEEALVELNKAIEIEAEAGFFFHRSQCFCQLKRYDEALRARSQLFVEQSDFQRSEADLDTLLGRRDGGHTTLLISAEQVSHSLVSIYYCARHKKTAE